jgi:hypothetical protein
MYGIVIRRKKTSFAAESPNPDALHTPRDIILISGLMLDNRYYYIVINIFLLI